MASRITIGLKATASHEVAPSDLAERCGGDLAALASPILVMFIERTCRLATDYLLEPGQTTVGHRFQIDHLAPTPAGQSVVVSCELVGAHDRMLTYKVAAHDASGRVAEGTHVRFVVDKERRREGVPG